MEKFSFFKSNKFKAFMMTTLACVACMAVTAFCAEGDFDVTSTMTSAVTEIAKTLMSGLGIVVTGIVGFMAAKIGVIKVLGFIKTMVGKA